MRGRDEIVEVGVCLTSMARNSRPTAAKREREKGLIERRQQKAERRRQEKERKAGSAQSAPDGVDPDIADIKLGPQPPAEWQIEEES
jgi:hypothetical protein